jgi:hypothetical protein
MWGKKVRVYYHGIPLFCVQCHTIGHSRADCDGNTLNWRDYIKKLRGNGINPELFGSWLGSNLSFSRESQNVPQPKFCKRSQELDDEDDEIDFDNLPPKMLKLIKQFQSSTPRVSPKNSASSSTKTSPKSNNKNFVTNRNRGRGNANSRDIVRAARQRRGGRGGRGGRGRGQTNTQT